MNEPYGTVDRFFGELRGQIFRRYNRDKGGAVSDFPVKGVIKVRRRR